MTQIQELADLVVGNWYIILYGNYTYRRQLVSVDNIRLDFGTGMLGQLIVPVSYFPSLVSVYNAQEFEA